MELIYLNIFGNKWMYIQLTQFYKCNFIFLICKLEYIKLKIYKYFSKYDTHKLFKNNN